MRSKLGLVGTALVLCLGLLLAACGGAGQDSTTDQSPATPPPSSSNTDPAPSSEPAPPEVVIGAIYPLTGSSAIAGTDLRNGVTLAMEIVNGEHPDLDLPIAQWNGLPNLGNAKLQVEFADHQADPNAGKAEAERLITEKNVTALLGAYNSAVTAAIAPVAERYQIPHLNAESSSPTLTEQGFEWFFRTTPHDGLFVEDVFRFLKEIGVSPAEAKIALVTENGVFGQDTAMFANEIAQREGYTIVEDLAYSAKATNVDAEIQRLKSKDADTVLMASYGPDTILYVQGFKAFDYNPKLIWGNDAGFIDSQLLPALGADAEYLVTREVWANDLATRKPIIGKLNDKFKEKYGMDLNGNSARALQGMLTLADAINRAGSTDAAAIQKALQETNLTADEIIMPWQGIKFDEKGQNVLGSGVIVQIQNGEYVTVWPSDVAAGQLVYPLPPWSER